MALSNKNVLALMLDLNQDIEEYAEGTVKKVIEERKFDLFYPPNNGLTNPEIQELKKLDNNKHLKNALRKVIADNCASVIFNLLALIDGIADPKNLFDDWTGVKLVNLEQNDDEEDGNDEESKDMLHDTFLESYWEWEKKRGYKN